MTPEVQVRVLEQGAGELHLLLWPIANRLQ